MTQPDLLTKAELAEIVRRRPGARACLACEGMILTAEEDALIDQMDRERLPADARTARIVAFVLAKQKALEPAHS